MEELFKEILNETLYQIILSNPADKTGISRLKIRPVMLKGELHFQETAYDGTKVFHKNYNKHEMAAKLTEEMTRNFHQCEADTTGLKATILVSKKGTVTIKKKQLQREQRETDLSHNRTKKYILQEGTVIPFLVRLGVQTPEGRIVRAKYDKFRQINRFLEFIEDISPTLSKEREIHIIDFGCGKSYLTFAVYYYLHVMQGLQVKITGLDLKKEVIADCRQLAEESGYDGLQFEQGDIGSYEEPEKVDMVMTLHACDTATDLALLKAVKWNAKVILSVPCCQHEVNAQIGCEILEPILKYGLLKERIAALVTDGVRANLLEEQGYQVQILEFIDMEHTPKNILIRAVKKNSESVVKTGIEKTADFLQVHTTLQKLI